MHPHSPSTVLRKFPFLEKLAFGLQPSLCFANFSLSTKFYAAENFLFYDFRFACDEWVSMLLRVVREGGRCDEAEIVKVIEIEFFRNESAQQNCHVSRVVAQTILVLRPWRRRRLRIELRSSACWRSSGAFIGSTLENHRRSREKSFRFVFIACWYVRESS